MSDLLFYSQDHSKCLKGGAINFLSSNVNFSDFEAQFDCIDRSHSIDLTAQVNQGFNVDSVLSKAERIMDIRHPL